MTMEEKNMLKNAPWPFCLLICLCSSFLMLHIVFLLNLLVYLMKTHTLVRCYGWLAYMLTLLIVHVRTHFKDRVHKTNRQKIYSVFFYTLGNNHLHVFLCQIKHLEICTNKIITLLWIDTLATIQASVSSPFYYIFNFFFIEHLLQSRVSLRNTVTEPYQTL